MQSSLELAFEWQNVFYAITNGDQKAHIAVYFRTTTADPAMPAHGKRRPAGRMGIMGHNWRCVSEAEGGGTWCKWFALDAAHPASKIVVQSSKQRIVWGVTWLTWDVTQALGNLARSACLKEGPQLTGWMLLATAVICSFRSRSAFKSTLKLYMCSFVQRFWCASLFLAVSSEKT